MMTELDRQIIATSPELRRRLAEAFSAFLIGELLAPGDDLWFVSAWISNIDCLDNRTGDFDALLGERPRRKLRLAEVLAHFIHTGRRVRLVVREDVHNDAFIQELTSLAGPPGDNAGWVLRRRKSLHVKGMLGAALYLSGSMNITYNGIMINDELVLLTRDPGKLTQARLQFLEAYQ
jgi:hypothetical protein